MPTKSSSGVSVFAVIFYLLVAVAVLKILRIIPDPAEPIDYTSIIITTISTLGGSAAIYAVRRVNNFVQRVSNIDNSLREINTEIKHMRDIMDINTRLARLEGRKH